MVKKGQIIVKQTKGQKLLHVFLRHEKGAVHQSIERCFFSLYRKKQKKHDKSGEAGKGFSRGNFGCVPSRSFFGISQFTGIKNG